MTREPTVETHAAAHPWYAVFRLAWPYRWRLLLVAIFAAFSAIAALFEPLIYRVAIDDVAGVFVGRAASRSSTDLDVSSAPMPPFLPATGLVREAVAAEQKPTPTPPRAHKVHRLHRHGRVAPRTPTEMLKTLLLAVVGLFITGLTAQLFNLLADNTATAAANRIEEDFISSTFAHVLNLRLRFFGPRSSGVIAKQIDQSDQVAPIITALAKDLLPEVFRIVGTFAIMFSQSVPLTLVALGTVPAYFILARRSARELETNLPRYYSLWEQVSAQILETIAGIKTVKLSGSENREVKRLAESTSAAYETYLDRNRVANRYLFWQSLLQQLGQALVLAYGGWAVLDHQLTPGDVVMFVSYLDRLYNPIDSLTTVFKTLQEHALSLDRALQLRTVNDTEPHGTSLTTGPGRVEFRDVHFGYTEDREVLHGISFTLEPHTLTALVGPSGAGKTTIADLLLRLHEPTSGSILIDGQPLSGVEPSTIRQAISVVSTDGAIFRASLADNIRYKRADASDADVMEAVQAAGLSRVLERLPEGLDTEIGESGVGLSVGERQRLQLARAFVSKSPILLLDEATANLDFATELEVKAALATMRHRCTALVIAHRFSMVQDADKVVVIDAGNVVSIGTPQDLVNAGGWFARMAHSSSPEDAT